MIRSFRHTTLDPFLWEALQTIPGVISAFCFCVGDVWNVDGRDFWPPQQGYLIVATGHASTCEEWEQRCQDAIDQAQRLLDSVSWIADDLNMEGV